ncbi:MAG: FkbM family methyltransferase [Saprospiraceae bacterium]
MPLLNTKNKIALASLCYKGIHALRALAGKSDITFVKRKKINWHLELNEGIDFSIYLLGSFEPGTINLYSKLLQNKPNAVVFDIGANIGSHTLPLAKIISPGKGIVYAFEPTKWAFEKLQRNINAMRI